MTSLTVFRINYEVEGELPDCLDDVVAPDLPLDSDIHDYIDEDFVARLYLPKTWPSRPKWAGFVEDGFPEATVGDAMTHKALLVAWVRRGDVERVFALAFGHARYCLREELIEPTFGRRAAVNLIYEEGDQEAGDNRVRQVDARTIEANVLRSRLQRSRDATFNTFSVDPERDLLDGIVGVPVNKARFGSRVTGGRSLHFDASIRFADLADLLWDIDEAHSRTTYLKNFSWVDKVVAIADQALVERLKGTVVELIRSGSGDVYLAPPDILDWVKVSTFTFELGSRDPQPDLRLEDYLGTIAESRVRGRGLTAEALAAHRVSVRDGDGTVIYGWSVFRCLAAEFELDGKHYVLDEGHFYAVSTDYLGELRESIAGIPDPMIGLPKTTADQGEAAYNQSVVAARPDFLLLDSRLAQPEAGTTTIEICDVLTAQGQLVHAKRKLASSALSHLFAQGYVSADTLHLGPEYRTAIRAKIQEQAQQSDRDPALFTRFLEEPFVPQNATVVYAILADWNGMPPSERLPFFSMVNLRHYKKRLQRMGFNVALAAVDAP